MVHVTTTNGNTCDVTERPEGLAESVKPFELPPDFEAMFWQSVAQLGLTPEPLTFDLLPSQLIARVLNSNPELCDRAGFDYANEFRQAVNDGRPIRFRQWPGGGPR